MFYFTFLFLDTLQSRVSTVLSGNPPEKSSTPHPPSANKKAESRKPVVNQHAQRSSQSETVKPLQDSKPAKPPYSKKSITNDLDNKIRRDLDEADTLLEKVSLRKHFK